MADKAPPVLVPATAAGQLGSKTESQPTPMVATGVAGGDTFDLFFTEGPIDTRASDYYALAPGQPYWDQVNYPGFVLLKEVPVSSNLVNRHWVNDRVNQDVYNYAITFFEDDPGTPIFARVYQERRSTYIRRTQGTALQTVYRIQLTAPGSGYVQPVAAITGGGGTGATAQCVLVPGTSGAIAEVLITATGSAYTSAPAVAITDAVGPGTGATATAFIQPAALFLVSESVVQYGEDSPFYSLYFQVVRIYTTLAPFKRIYPGQTGLSGLPPILTSILGTWSSSLSTSNSSETGGSLITAGPFTVDIRISNHNENSGDFQPEITPIWKEIWEGDLYDVTDYFFFLLNPVTKTQILTAITALAGSSVLARPKFFTEEPVIILIGQGAEVGATAKASLSSSAPSNSLTDNYLYSSGGEASTKFRDTIRAVTLKRCIHGVLTIGGGGDTKTGNVTATAYATIAGDPDPNVPITQIVNVPISAGVLAPQLSNATTPAVWPSSGLALWEYDCRDFGKWGYTGVHCRVLDWSTV